MVLTFWFFLAVSCGRSTAKTDEHSGSKVSISVYKYLYGDTLGLGNICCDSVSVFVLLDLITVGENQRLGDLVQTLCCGREKRGGGNKDYSALHLRKNTSRSLRFHFARDRNLDFQMSFLSLCVRNATAQRAPSSCEAEEGAGAGAEPRPAAVLTYYMVEKGSKEQ